MPPDWAFGAEAPTLGKAMARWAMHLYLGVADSPMRRYVLDDDELDDWRWLPDTGCAAEPRPRHGWLSYDVCEAAARRLSKPGVAIGLAYTPFGGDVLYIEASKMGGSGQVTITGQLGDVMKESARTALSWLRAAAPRLGLVDASSGAALAETVS